MTEIPGRIQQADPPQGSVIYTIGVLPSRIGGSAFRILPGGLAGSVYMVLGSYLISTCSDPSANAQRVQVPLYQRLRPKKSPYRRHFKAQRISCRSTCPMSPSTNLVHT